MIGGAVNHVRDMGVSENMYIMLCGRMTPEQRQIIGMQVRFDSEKYMDILNYFITKSGHPGYAGLSLPENFPEPIFVADKPNHNETDAPMNEEVERAYAGGTYFFSTAQDPSNKTSVYDDIKQFATAMLNQSSPTLLTVGG